MLAALPATTVTADPATVAAAASLTAQGTRLSLFAALVLATAEGIPGAEVVSVRA